MKAGYFLGLKIRLCHGNLFKECCQMNLYEFDTCDCTKRLHFEKIYILSLLFAERRVHNIVALACRLCFNDFYSLNWYDYSKFGIFINVLTE